MQEIIVRNIKTVQQQLTFRKSKKLLQSLNFNLLKNNVLVTKYHYHQVYHKELFYPIFYPTRSYFIPYFINHLTFVNSYPFKYADHTTLILPHFISTTTEISSHQINMMENWCNKNVLKENIRPAPPPRENSACTIEQKIKMEESNQPNN